MFDFSPLASTEFDPSPWKLTFLLYFIFPDCWGKGGVTVHLEDSRDFSMRLVDGDPNCHVSSGGQDPQQKYCWCLYRTIWWNKTWSAPHLSAWKSFWHHFVSWGSLCGRIQTGSEHRKHFKESQSHFLHHRVNSQRLVKAQENAVIKTSVSMRQSRHGFAVVSVMRLCNWIIFLLMPGDCLTGPHAGFERCGGKGVLTVFRIAPGTSTFFAAACWRARCWVITTETLRETPLFLQ